MKDYFDLKSKDGEIWKAIEGYEDEYEISNLGRVKSLERKGNGNLKIHERILKPTPNNHGYYRVRLHRKRFFVHRLVGHAFIENIYDYPCLNHKDNDPTNNRADNLEWCTHLYNMQYAQKQGRLVRKNELREKLRKVNCKKVKAYVLSTGEIERYESLKAAANHLKGSSGNICWACKHPHIQYYGRKWAYDV